MKFDVIGSGAIGLLFASKLSENFHPVTLWTRTEDSAVKFSAEGIFFSSYNDVQQQVKVLSYTMGQYFQRESGITEPDDHEKVDFENEPRYAILTVKQSHITPHLLEQLKNLVNTQKYSALIAFQNGVGHIDKLSKSLYIPIITAVTSEAAKRDQHSHVTHTGSGVTMLGDELSRDIEQKHMKNIEQALKIAGFEAQVSKNIKENIYKKLIINSVINPLTALFNVCNGDLPHDKQRLQLMEKLFIESQSILAIEEKSIEALTLEDILQVCIATYHNTSSMRADLLNGHETETVYINGAIVRMANRHMKQAPINESVLHLIQALHPNQ